MSLFPFVSFDSIELEEANHYLVEWGHKMGPLNRPMNGDSAHAIRHEGRALAVVTTSSLIRPNVGGACSTSLVRMRLSCRDCAQLARLSAASHFVCGANSFCRRSVLASATRTPTFTTAIPIASMGGAAPVTNAPAEMDPRSGRKGRNRWIWVWPPEAVQ